MSNLNLEIKIGEEYFPYEIKDFLSGKTVYKNGQPRIGINPYLPITRQPFTLFHELSHYILHINNNLFQSQNFNSLINDEFNGRNLEEQEADTLVSYIMVNPYAFMRAFALKNN